MGQLNNINWSFYRTIFKLGFKEQLIQPQKMWADIFVNMARICVLIALYKFAYAYKGGDIAGVSFQVAVWSIAIYFIMLAINVRRIFALINNDVQFGEVEKYLPKPVSYVGMRSVYNIGKNALNFIVSIIFGSIIVTLLVGVPHVSSPIVIILFALPLLLLGMVIISLTYTLVGFAAFYMENAEPLNWIIDRGLFMILSGGYVPVVLFPTVLQWVATLLPFGAGLFIAQIFREDFVSRLPIFLGIQLAWIFILGYMVYFFWNKIQKKLFVNGG